MASGQPWGRPAGVLQRKSKAQIKAHTSPTTRHCSIVHWGKVGCRTLDTWIGDQERYNEAIPRTLGPPLGGWSGCLP
ncbi:hypothetical protein EMPG_10486 [Blastomyces silverae]|uniref:Uncharacterized protein n=1 Tax=Blastomyces silverae TaxID=2060906 RepID=A0A0H1BA12_9EURO|nr:hypothetical protein EMPG_10486 [Blastomyces silverae]